MYDNLDKSTNGIWHQEFVGAAKDYVRTVIAACPGDSESGLSQFGIEVRGHFSATDKAKVAVKRILRKAGYELVQVGYGKSKRHRLIKVESANDRH